MVLSRLLHPCLVRPSIIPACPTRSRVIFISSPHSTMKYSRYILTFFIVVASGIAISYADVIVNNIVPPTQLLPIINSKWAGDAIGAIIVWLIRLTAILAVLAITCGSIQMILAIWEDEKFKKARYTMIYAFIGLVVAGLAYASVNFVTNLKLDNFL